MVSQFEKNLINSFSEVRKDIAEIKMELFKLSEEQERLHKSISKNKK